MSHVVITVIGEDRAGLVETLAGVIATHHGNWERSRMAELAGKFAGIVEVTLPESNVGALIADLDAIENRGLLDVTLEQANPGVTHEVSGGAPSAPLQISLIGQDHPGIVHDISGALASMGVSIDELETETLPAPNGGFLFSARATLDVPEGIEHDDVQRAVEAVANDLMVDLEFDD